MRTRLKAIQRGKHKVASSSAEDGPSATTTTEEEGEAPSKESLQGFMMKMEQILSKIVVDGWENGVKEHRVCLFFFFFSSFSGVLHSILCYLLVIGFFSIGG